MTEPRESFPRQQARTRRFRLGAPRSFAVSPDGERVAFLRSPAGDDPASQLLVLDVGTGAERVAADPRVLLGDRAERVPDAERARRERLRETTAGITAYATDRELTVAAFALSGHLGIARLAASADLSATSITEIAQQVRTRQDSDAALLDAEAALLLDVPGPVVDPRPDPTGQRVAWVAGGSLYAAAIDGSDVRLLAAPESASQTWGLADFVAAEEFDRIRGFWWSPDGSALIAELCDESAVCQWWIGDPARPDAPPRSHRYPVAGSANPAVSLWIFDVDQPSAGTSSPADRGREIEWDHSAYPYLISVRWQDYGRPLVTVLDRAQRRQVTFEVNPADLSAHEVADSTDEAWVEVIAGVPRWAPGGRLVLTVDDRANDTRRLVADGDILTPPGLQVRAVLDADERGVLICASDEPASCTVLRVGYYGTTEMLSPADGWHTATGSGDVLVLASATLSTQGTRVQVTRPGQDPIRVESRAQSPSVTPAVTLHRAGPDELRTAVLWPAERVPGTRLPVLLCPYGGPHAQRVIEAGSAFTEAQWLADQGFCVVISDGRGTPGRGPAWERAVRDDLATPALDDQVAVVEWLAAQWPEDVDTGRVGITGWSFGGYLAALAVLRRPDIFHAAVAGAPVTEWRLYDTAYTERYLGLPGENPAAYDRSSLLPLAAGLTRPLMLIHGLADDNVVAAHTLRLSAALLADGRPHAVLPLSGVTHMAPQEQVAENLLNLQVEFLREHLA